MIMKCPTCGYVMAVEDGLDGAVVECPKCHKEFIVMEKREPTVVRPERRDNKPVKPVANKHVPDGGGLCWTWAVAALVMAMCTHTIVLNGQRPVMATVGIVMSVFAIGKAVREKLFMAVAVAAAAVVLFVWAGISSSGEIDRAARSMNHAATAF